MEFTWKDPLPARSQNLWKYLEHPSPKVFHLKTLRETLISLQTVMNMALIYTYNYYQL